MNHLPKLPALKALMPTSQQHYQLLDSGDFEKLERWGKVVVARPEPQAWWPKRRSDWASAAQATFLQQGSHNGEWKLRPPIPDRWQVSYPLAGKDLRFRLAFTQFKHLGLFPEHSPNWDWLHAQCKRRTQPTVLNLFAYTGAASLAAAAAGASVTHVDAVKQVVGWAQENAELSQLDGIRWWVDDALKLIQREQRRSSLYDGIILDPPAYGIGPKGERWKLEEQLHQLMQSTAAVLKPDGFVLLNAYSLGLSAYGLYSLCADLWPERIGMAELVELLLPEEPIAGKSCRVLPAGISLRLDMGRG